MVVLIGLLFIVAPWWLLIVALLGVFILYRWYIFGCSCGLLYDLVYGGHSFSISNLRMFSIVVVLAIVVYFVRKRIFIHNDNF